MKIRMTLLVIMITAIGFGQGQVNIESTDNVKVEIKSLTVTIDSENDIQSLKLKDIEEVFELSDDNTPISLKIICSGEKITNGHKSSMSMKVDGNTIDLKTFIKHVKKLKRVAINYYKEKPKKQS